MTNPAFAGIEGDATIRFSYLDFYPGNHYNLNSVFVSYDAYMPVLHGGTGVYISNDYLGGIVNDIRGGLSYSYHLQANKNFFLNAGLTASFYHRGFTNANIILPDQIDPLNGPVLPSGETISDHRRTVLDIGTGFLFIVNRFYGAVSLNHLTNPDLSGLGKETGKLKQKLTLNLAWTFNILDSREILARPLIFSEIQDNHISAGAGSTVESKFLSVNALVLFSNSKSVDLQTGFSIKTGKIFVFYNYRFNIASENILMPLSLLHQTGIAVSLNNVDKRKTVKTINFTKL
jgi:type IX secretion system PorP/SprF family membrane protein